MLLDFDLSFLNSLVASIDEHLDELNMRAEACPDPDSFGVYDEMEYVIGLGFVACQSYLGATAGRVSLETWQALPFGPKHRNGKYVVSLINACANYWKHGEEWAAGRKRSRAEKTVEVLRTLGVDAAGPYPLTEALHELASPEPPRFASMVVSLTRWRNALHGRQAT